MILVHDAADYLHLGASPDGCTAHLGTWCGWVSGIVVRRYVGVHTLKPRKDIAMFQPMG